MRRLILLVLLGTSISCAIPERDNPFDAQNLLAFRAYVQLPDGGRSDVGSHGAQWTLDLSAECDAPCADTFDFDLDGDASNGFELVGAAAVSTTALPWTPAEFATGPTTVRTLAVRRGIDRGFATVVLTNSSPVANPGPDAFVPSQRGGIAVLDACGGGSATLCSSSDPDGDTLTFNWRPLAPTSIVPSPTGPANGARASFDVPASGEHTFYFELEATDGMTSTFSRTRVFVGTQVWLSYTSPGELYRVTPGQRVTGVRSDLLSGCVGACGVYTFAHDPQTGFMWLHTSDGPHRVLRHAPGGDLTTEPTWDLPGSPGGELPNFAASNSAAVLVLDDGSLVRVRDPLDPVEVIALPGGSSAESVVRADDSGPSAGAFWVLLDDAVGRLEPGASAVVPLAGGPAVGFAFSASRTPDGGLLYLDPAGGGFHIAPDGTWAQLTLAAAPSALVAGPDGGYWATVSVPPDNVGQVVALDSAGNITATAPFAAASAGYLTLYAAPDSSVWIGNSAGGTLSHVQLVDGEAILDGIVHGSDFSIPGSSDSGTLFSGASIDPSSGVLHAVVFVTDVPQGIGVAEIPLFRDTVIGVDPGFVPSLASIDPAHGTAWAPFEGGSIMRRIDATGRATLSYQIDDTSFMPALANAADRDGSVWVVYSDNATKFALRHVSWDGEIVGAEIVIPSSTPYAASVTPILDETLCLFTRTSTGDIAYRVDLAAGTATALTPPPQYMQASAIAGDGACWWADGIPPRVVRVPAGSTNADIITPEMPDYAVGMAIAPREGSAYIRWSQLGDIVRIDTSGNVTSLTGVPPGGTGALGAQDCSTDSSCTDLWLSAGSSLHRMRLNGTALEPIERFDGIPPGPTVVRVLPGDAFLP